MIKKKEREEEGMDKIIEKSPSSNDELHVEYNLEENSYQLKSERKQDEKYLLLKVLEALNKRIKKLKNPRDKRELKQIKKHTLISLKKKIWGN